MRLSETKIKEALLHPEKPARQEALLYFANCHSPDAAVMPLAIKAIETYGREGAFLTLYHLADLPQTETTVEWAIRELYRKADNRDVYDEFFPALSRLLCHADPQLLLPRAKEIVEAPGFCRDVVPEFQDRLQLAAWDADQCWKELEAICAQGVSKQAESDVDLGHAGQVVEALARQADPGIERILELLGKDVENFETDPMVWMEILLVNLAGQLRLERAIPLLVRKLRALGEVLSQACVEAFGRIGTDAAAAAITEEWQKTEWDYRLYAVSALEKIHSDTTLHRCLELLPQEEDSTIRTELADAVLGQLAPEGIEPVRELVLRQRFDPRISDIPERLVAVSMILEVQFPEYSVWKRAAEKRQAQIERNLKEMRPILQPVTPPTPAAAPTPARERSPSWGSKAAPVIRTEKRVGRNDPCPCGSGKKYKKCCMDKSKG